MSQINPETKRQQAFKKLYEDYPFYARHALKIRTKLGTISPLILNKAQWHLHTELEKQRQKQTYIRAIVMKGRQEGISTYIGGRFFHKTSMRKGTTTFILSHESKSTANLFDMVKRYNDHLPANLAPGLETSNKNQLKFEGLESEYTVGTAGNEDVGRSMTIKQLHMSEAAFYSRTDELETGLMQAVADVPGTEIVIESTANGLGNFFHEKAMRAQAGLGDYILVFCPWYWQDEYRKTPPDGFAPDEYEQELMRTYKIDLEQVYWRRVKIENTKGGLWKFQQEYPFTPEEAFLMSGETFFTKESIMTGRRNTTTSPNAPRIGGMDCGRNNDRSVIGYRQGRAVVHYDVHKDLRADGREPTQQLIHIAQNYIDKHRLDKLFIDFGYGHGVIDGLRSLPGYKKIVQGVDFGGGATNKVKYLNKRSEMYGDAREWLEEGDTSIPDSDEFAFDLLLTPKEKKTPSDKVVLPSKTAIKEERKVSPDICDFFVLTFAFPVKRREREEEYHKPKRKVVSKESSPLRTLQRLKNR